MDYITRLEEKISRCLTHLQNQDFEKLRAESPGTSPLDEMHAGDATANEFASTLLKTTHTDDLDAAGAVLGEIDWDKALIRECQLLLMAIFLDVEDRNINAICDDFMHLARHASRLAEHSPSQYGRLCETALALADDDFWRFEVASRAAMHYCKLGDQDSARKWLDGLPATDPGVFAPRVEWVRSVLKSNDE